LPMAIADIDGVAASPEVRANPAAVPPALRIATAVTTVIAANFRPAKRLPSLIAVPIPFAGALASVVPAHEQPVMAM
jgi:hypothetical protein